MDMDKRIMQMVDEAAANRIKELEAELGKWKNRVAWQHCDKHGEIKADYAWGCPDCVDELRRDNSNIRACLKKLEWAEDAYGNDKYCPACGWSDLNDRHASDCWLAKELEGE